MQWPGAVAALRNCCSIDFCESQLGRADVRTRLRVGSTTGLRDEPLNAALSQKRYDQMPGAQVEWVQMPRDLNAVGAMLTAGLMDLAAVYSEDVVAQLTGGCPDLRICGTFQAVPRRWCCLVLPGVQKEHLTSQSSCMIGIPSGGMGPKMMLLLWRERLGFTGSTSITCTSFENLNAAIRTLLRGGKVRALLWEVSKLEQFMAQDWCDIIDEFITPWPSHLLVAHKETLFAKLCTIKYFMCFTNLFLQDFQTDIGGESLEYILKTYPDLRPAEVGPWLEAATWTCMTDVELASLEEPLELLIRLELRPANLRFSPTRHLARGVRIRNSSVRYCQAPPVPSASSQMPSGEEENLTSLEELEEEEAEQAEEEQGEESQPDSEADILVDPTDPERDEGRAHCLPDARLHNLLSRPGCPVPCGEAPAARSAAVAAGEKPRRGEALGRFRCIDDRPAPAG
mmetsp:Transcript_90327/g.286175  ORF Transcript_90327/g.286175 Transcript_90327/m.286175 type:complete len:455 (+) Transcript_90327:88-1452(+)